MADLSFDDLIPQDTASAKMRELYPDEPTEDTGVSFDDLIPEQPKQTELSFDDLIPEDSGQSDLLKSASAVRKSFTNDPEYEYGDILPIKKNIKTGEKSFAVPEFIRSAFRGTGDLVETAENKEIGVTPDALNAMAFMLPATPGGKGMDIPTPTLLPEKPPIVDKTTPPVLDSQLTAKQELTASQYMQEAKEQSLMQVQMGARNPTTLTPEQTAAAKATAVPARPIEEIDAEIAMFAADTSSPGAKERIALLQQEKAEALNPKLLIEKQRAERSELMQQKGTSLSDDQILTNFKEPIQNAIDSGASTAEVEAAIRAGWQDTGRPAHELETIIERVLPNAYKEATTEAKVSAAATGTAPDAVESLVGPAVKNPDDGSVPPSLAPEDQQLGASAVEKIMGSNLAKLRSREVDDLNIVDLINRAWVKLNNKNAGAKDIMERGDITPFKNISQRGAAMMHSLVGDAAGTNNYILVDTGRGVLEKNTNILPFNTSVRLAKNGGMTDAEISEFLRARDSYDDYANIDRLGAEVKQKAADNQRLLDTMHQQDTAGMNPKQKRALFNKIQATRNDMAENLRFLKDLNKKQSHMSREEAAATLQKYETNATARLFGENVNKLHSHLLDVLVDSGKISAESASALRKAHPNYLPAYRDVDDFTFGKSRYQQSGGSPKPFKKREISNKELGDTYENIVTNIISTARKAEQAKFRGGILQEILIPKLDDAAFNVVFREKKQDVIKAINDLNSSKRQRITAEEVTPTDPDKIQIVGNIVFDINGKQLQLTIKDPSLFKEISQSRRLDEINNVGNFIVTLSRLNRNLITTYNPAFSIKAFFRDVSDFGIMAKGKPFKDYVPVVSNFKHIFTKEFDPELYEAITNNVGFGSLVARDYYGKNVEEIVKIGRQKLSSPNETVKESFLSGESSGGSNSVTRTLENFANRIDLAPRILQYKISYKRAIADGLPEQEAKAAAIRAARELNVNYAQKGTDPYIDRYIKMVPFARTYINSTDRLIRLARHEPKKLALGITVGAYLPYAAIMQYNQQFKDADGISYVDKLDPNKLKDMMPIYGPWSKSSGDYFPWRLGWGITRSMNALDKTVHYGIQQIGKHFDDSMRKEAQEVVDNNESIKRTGLTGKEVYSAWLDYTFGLVQPSSLFPPVVNQLVALESNKDSFGRTIVPSDLQDVPAFAQYREGETSQALTDFAYYVENKYGVPFSPIQAEYVIKSLGASAATIGLTAANYMYAASTGRELPEIENKNIPFFNVFSGKGSAVETEGVPSKFYNIDKALQPVKDTYDALKKEAERNPAHAPDLLQFEFDNAVELHYIDKFDDALKKIKQYRDAINKIATADKNTLQGEQTPEIERLGDPKKRASISELQKKILDIQKGMLDDIQNSPQDTDEIWNERLTHTPATKVLEAPISVFEKQSKNTDGNSGFFSDLGLVSDAEASVTSRGATQLAKSLGVNDPNKIKEAARNATIIEQQAQLAGADADYFLRLAAQESRLGLNTGKGNKGIFQITDPTYKLLRDKYPEAKALKRQNPIHNAKLAILLAKDDGETFKKSFGRYPTQKEAYAIHFLGMGDYLKIFKAKDKNLPAKQLAPAAAKSNPTIFRDNATPEQLLVNIVDEYAKWDRYLD